MPKPLNYLNDITDIQKYIIGSHYLNETIEPIGLISIAGAGKGKTASQSQFDNMNYQVPIGLHLGDFTQIDIFGTVYKEFLDRKCNLIFWLSDLNQLVTRNFSTVARLFGVLLLATEKNGLESVKDDTGHVRNLLHPLRFSFITACTPQVFDKYFIWLFDLGILDRLLPLTWSTTIEQERQIKSDYQDLIAQPKLKPNPLDKPEKLEYKKQHITMKRELSEQLLTIGETVNATVFDKYIWYLTTRKGFNKNATEEQKKEKRRLTTGDIDIGNIPLDTLQKRIQDDKERHDKEKPSSNRYFTKLCNLARGKALIEGRTEVEQSDIERIAEICTRHMNFDYNYLQCDLSSIISMPARAAAYEASTDTKTSTGTKTSKDRDIEREVNRIMRDLDDGDVLL